MGTGDAVRRTAAVERGIASADALSSMEGIPEGAVVPEPEGEAAVEQLGSRFVRLDGQVRHALRRTRDHAGNLSSDRLQGLSEIVHNAEDLGATDVRILIPGPSRDYYLENAPKGCSMSRHCSPLHAAGSTSYGPCFVISGASPRPHPPPNRLDTIIETHSTKACGRSITARYGTNEAPGLMSWDVEHLSQRNRILVRCGTPTGHPIRGHSERDHGPRLPSRS